jgi:nicotinamide mononucleotide transporter
MPVSSFFDIFYQNLLATTWLEGIAVLFGLLSVWYAKKANILVFPTGIISVLIYVYICFVAGLYADMGINAFYFLMSVYGWYKWTRKDASEKMIAITKSNTLQHFAAAAGAVVFFVILRYVLINYTDSTVPTWDAITTAIFIIGMWLMALKKLENWVYWIIGNTVSIPLYFHKSLVLTSFQYSVFLVLAILGYIQWRNAIKKTTNA